MLILFNFIKSNYETDNFTFFFFMWSKSIDYKIIVDSNDEILTKNSNIKLSLNEAINEGESSVNF